jgi:hypothetical protein
MGGFYIEPPKDEPWLLGSVPRDIQEYFDEIHNEIETLTMVPCPKGENSWNRTIQPYTWEVGNVCCVFASYDDGLLMSAL